METIARDRGTPIVTSAKSSRGPAALVAAVAGLETTRAIAPAAAEIPRFVAVVSNVAVKRVPALPPEPGGEFDGPGAALGLGLGPGTDPGPDPHRRQRSATGESERAALPPAPTAPTARFVQTNHLDAKVTRAPQLPVDVRGRHRVPPRTDEPPGCDRDAPGATGDPDRVDGSDPGRRPRIPSTRAANPTAHSISVRETARTPSRVTVYQDGSDAGPRLCLSPNEDGLPCSGGRPGETGCGGRI